jgi:site-specific DNA recombinase
VSTDSSDQLESYKAQVAYYTDAIAKNPKWRFAGIYADEGIIYGEQKLKI